MLRRLYEWVMAKAAHPHAEWWLFAFAFAESSFFPVPPHPLLGLMCLAEPRRAIRFAAITVVASVLGGFLGYAIGYYLYEGFGQTLLAWLGLTKSFPTAACYLREYGAEIILIKGATPIPFKLIAITAGFVRLDLWTFAWATTASRGFVFLLVGFLFRMFGAPIKAFIDKYLGLATAGFVILIAGGFFAVTLIGGGKGKNDQCNARNATTAITAPR